MKAKRQMVVWRSWAQKRPKHLQNKGKPSKNRTDNVMEVVLEFMFPKNLVSYFTFQNKRKMDKSKVFLPCKVLPCKAKDKN